MEGVAGVCAWQQVDARTPHPDFAIFRRYYTQEVAGAIEGARAGGAAEVLVNDSHGPMRNLLLDELPRRCSRHLRQPQTVLDGARCRPRL